MKKVLPLPTLILTVILSLIVCFNAKAQGIYQLWGSTPYGGQDNSGVLFSMKYDATGFRIKKDYPATNPGRAYYSNKPVAYNGKLYSILYHGGINDHGVITEFNPANNSFTKKADLFSIGGLYAAGHLIVYNNKLYGITASGGDNEDGVIFEYNPANGVLSAIYHFSEPTGGFSYGSLTLYNNKFYGTTIYGGAFGDGTVFEFDPATNIYTKKADFNRAANGHFPVGAMVVYNNKLWGTCNYGGAEDEGTLFSFDPATNTLSKKYDFAHPGLYHPGQLTLLNNKLYGSATRGGASNVFGGIFEYNPATNICANVFDFDYNTTHFDIELAAYNGRLYGTSTQGGTGGDGALFWYNPTTDVYHTELSFTETTGTKGYGGMTLYNGKLYGFTSAAAAWGAGSLFSFDPAGSQYTNLVHLGGPELRQPEGSLLYYNNKIYGTTSYGGDHKRGGIYEYDIASGTYTIKYSMQSSGGNTSLQGGFIAYNNKFYGVTRYGGANQVGALYEYDPATNTYTKKHDFEDGTGSWPYGQLAVYGGKLYGMTSTGSANNMGNIYEYDPATGVYSQKVIMSANFGGYSRSRLTWHNNRFYGVCYGGGANGEGTVFEYNPAINSFIKKADFDSTNGAHPFGGLTVWKDKLYGLTFSGGSKDSGVLYQYDPATAIISKNLDLHNSIGVWPANELTLLNNKLYGMMNEGGANSEGNIFQYDPATNIFTTKLDFNSVNGKRPVANNLIAIPAITAPGSPGSCTNTQTVNINAANANEWIPFTDAEGRAVAEINANGNILGNTAVRFFVNGGNIRQNGNGQFYLDRNITITSANQPATPVSIRLYVRKSEFESLKATAGSGVVVPSDLAIYKNDDFCSATMNSSAVKLTTVKGDWATDYVFTTNVTSFSSFYFASGTQVALPIHLLSFSGQKQGAINRLQWKASCTGGVNFRIERSVDGTQFHQIGLVMAAQPDCDRSFSFTDASPQAKSWYRLQLEEDNGQVTYSSIIYLDRNPGEATGIAITPNPAKGGTAYLNISGTLSGNSVLTVVDMTGRVLKTMKVDLSNGTNSIPVDIRSLPSGVYVIVLTTGQTKQTTRFIKE
jgi:uncharacterized repeat protein (TIGR03803 family)